MKKIVFAITVLCLFSTSVWAGKTTYIATNHRFNFIKLKEISPKEAEARKITHPAKLDEQGLRAALSSVKLAKSYIIKKEVDTQEVFDESAVNYLAPSLVKAFEQATANEEVVFSYLSKNPFFIIRNDRLNICKAWISGDELHIKFEKLYAKVLGDTDKRGNEAKAASKAIGLRVKLEAGPGQQFGVDDTEEIVLNLHYNYVKPDEPEKKPEPITMAGEKPAVETPKDEAAKEDKKAAKSKKDKKAKEEAPVEQPQPKATPQERLEQLKQLKKDGLINKDEYDEKKKEILKEL